jgi:hypothetical protein
MPVQEKARQEAATAAEASKNKDTIAPKEVVIGGIVAGVLLVFALAACFLTACQRKKRPLDNEIEVHTFFFLCCTAALFSLL